jgi:hypothetical protein
LLARANHCDNSAGFASTRGAACAVQIILVIIRWIDVNHQADTVNVNTTSGNVGRN